jgi:hypothetical protein
VNAGIHTFKQTEISHVNNRTNQMQQQLDVYFLDKLLTQENKHPIAVTSGWFYYSPA